MALEAAALKTMRPGRHPDGRYGLYFNVAGNSRTWVRRLTVDGKRRNFGLGPWPVVSLAEARETAFENVRKRQRGIHLVTGRRRARTVPTFAQAADAYIALQAPGWKAGSRNESNWRSSLAHAAAIAERPMDAITTDDVLAVVTDLLRAGKAPTARSTLRKARHGGAAPRDTAHRLRGSTPQRRRQWKLAWSPIRCSGALPSAFPRRAASSPSVASGVRVQRAPIRYARISPPDAVSPACGRRGHPAKCAVHGRASELLK